MTTRKLPLRQRRRRSQRGAAIFVVVLVIALVAALGVFAMRSAGVASLSSGYNRQLTQVHYITDMAVHAAVSDVADNPDGVKRQMEIGPDTGGGEAVCMAHAELKADGRELTCWMRSYDDLQVMVAAATGEKMVVPEQNDKPGSLGPAPLEADMRIELTDLHPALPIAGFQQAGGIEANVQQMHAYVTVSANGLVRPKQPATNSWQQGNVEVASSSGIEISRAHVIMGPVQMQR